MRKRILISMPLALFGVLFGGGPVLAQAAEPDDTADLIRRVVANWRERQATTRAIICRGTVESFYPKGCLTSEIEPRPGQTVAPFPAVDETFRGEPVRWVLDLASGRARKERTITRPAFQPGSCTMRLGHETDIYANKRYRLFRPRDLNAWIGEKNLKNVPEVFNYEQKSLIFMFDGGDLPLFWLAGTVHGKLILPTQMTGSGPAEAFQPSGRAECQGRACVILLTREQDSESIVREFWIGIDPPHPIVRCRIRTATEVHNTWEIGYQPGGQLPTWWKQTDYLPPDFKQFTSRTYRVETLLINPAVPEAEFDDTIPAESVVFDVPKNDVFRADSAGNLIPLVDEPARVTRWWRYILAGTAVLLVVGLVALRYARRSGRS